MRNLVPCIALVALAACVPYNQGQPIRWDAVHSFKAGETTPDDAFRELGPAKMMSAIGPNEVMYGWTYWDGQRSETVFLRFRDGRLVDPTAAAPTPAKATP